MIKNISFVFQKIWQKHRGLLCYLILCVLSSLGISVVAVWFPAFVVSRISTGKADAAQLAAAGLVTSGSFSNGAPCYTGFTDAAIQLLGLKDF